MQHAPHEPTPPTDALRFDGKPVDLERQDDYDALADLFLGDEPADLPLQRARRHERGNGSGNGGATETAASIEGLILGHLPVRGTAWTSQYAEAMAQDIGASVALLRIGGGMASIDIFGVKTPGRAPFEPASLETALVNARRIAPRWIVQSDELNEGEMVNQSSLDRITLLAGTNEASIVATYRAIKGMASGAGSAGLGEIAIAIVGAAAAEAEGIRDRIERASTMFLAQPIELAASIEQVGPTSAVKLFDGPAPGPLSSILDHLREHLDQRQSRDDTTVRPRSESQTPDLEPVVRTEACRATTRTPSANSGLARHVEGLIQLQARSPDDPDTEFAVDHSGRLHLLREDSTGFERLTVTRAWAQKHAQLLSLTTPDSVAVDPSHEPEIHLFTPDPKRVRHLLDANVKVHIRAKVVTEEGHSAWFTAELN